MRMMHPERSPSSSANTEASDSTAVNQTVIQSEHRSLALLVTLCVLTGMSLMGTAWAINMAYRAQERADLAQLEVESFKNVLHAAKLPTSAHLPGESP
jgi:hypothetical protein